MTEKKVMSKLQEQRGASLAIALVYFIVCAMVGSVVLGAAMANLSHMKAEKVNESSYLAVMSAGLVLKEQLKNSAGEWSVVHEIQDYQAGVEGKTAFKKSLSGIIRPKGDKGASSAISEGLYKVYLNCVREDNRLEVPAEEALKKAMAVTLTLNITLDSGTLEDEADMAPVIAVITFTPDYAVMDSADSQQLQVRVAVQLSVDKINGEGQYVLNMSSNGVVYYMLEETVMEKEIPDDFEGEEDEVEGEYRYRYEDRVVLSSSEPFFTGAYGLGRTETGDSGT